MCVALEGNLIRRNRFILVESIYLQLSASTDNTFRHLDVLLTLLRLPVIDPRLHCVLVAHSSKSTMPDLIPWWEPWKASQLMTELPAEPLPASRTQTLNPDVETDFTHSAAGSWNFICLLPWLRVTKTFTSPESWNSVLKETDWQPWLFWEVSVMMTFPAWKMVAKKDFK